MQNRNINLQKAITWIPCIPSHILPTVVAMTMFGLINLSYGALPNLRVRASNPHLIEDVNGNPFFMAGYCPHNMIGALTYPQMEAYFADHQAKKMNFAWVELESWGMTDAYSHPFFVSGTSIVPSNLNPAYVASVDSVVAIAERHSCYLWLDVTNCPPWSISSYSLTDLRNFGRFWGGRYKSRANVHWAFGDDEFITDRNNQIALGIKDSMPNQLMCIDCNQGCQPYDQYQLGCTWINCWGWYAYGNPFGNTVREYNRSPVQPTFIYESGYEGEHYYGSTGDAWMIRQQMYSTVLGGGSGFGMYGDSHWEDVTLVQLPGYLDVPYCVNFFATRPWYKIVPDTGHTFVTVASSSDSNLAAGLTTDHTLGLCFYLGYAGVNHNITVDMSKMSGSTTARWFDGNNGNFTAIGGSPFANSGSHTFTTPGNNSDGKADWLLVLESGATTVARDAFSDRSIGSASSNANPRLLEGSINLQKFGTAGDLVTICDIKGKMIARKILGASGGRENLRLSTGIYLIKVSGHLNKTLQMIISH